MQSQYPVVEAVLIGINAILQFLRRRILPGSVTWRKAGTSGKWRAAQVLKRVRVARAGMGRRPCRAVPATRYPAATKILPLLVDQTGGRNTGEFPRARQ